MITIKHLIITVSLSMLFVFSACGTDDATSTISQSERDVLDDAAIQNYLKTHYFLDNGRVAQCADGDCDTAGKTALIDEAGLGSVDGVYYVKHPINTGNGSNPSVNDTISLQYISYSFTASRDGDSAVTGKLTESLNTINSSTIPQRNPNFWLYVLDDIDEEIGVSEAFFEMEGVQSALQQFNSTDRCSSNSTLSPPVQFQGIIIAPSRMVYGRRGNIQDFGIDTSFILNFEMCSLEPAQ